MNIIRESRSGVHAVFHLQIRGPEKEAMKQMISIMNLWSLKGTVAIVRHEVPGFEVLLDEGLDLLLKYSVP